MPHKASYSQPITHSDFARYKQENADREDTSLSVELRALLLEKQPASSLSIETSSSFKQKDANDDAQFSISTATATGPFDFLKAERDVSSKRRASTSVLPSYTSAWPPQTPSEVSDEDDTRPCKVPQPGEEGFDIAKEMAKMQKSFFIWDNTPAEDVMGYWPMAAEERAIVVNNMVVWSENHPAADLSEEEGVAVRLATIAKLKSSMTFAKDYSCEPVLDEVMAAERVSNLPPELRSIPAIDDSEDWDDDDSDWETVYEDDDEEFEGWVENEVLGTNTTTASTHEHDLSTSPFFTFIRALDVGATSLALSSLASNNEESFEYSMHQVSNMDHGRGLGIVVPQNSCEPDQTSFFTDGDLANSPATASFEFGHDDPFLPPPPLREDEAIQSNIISNSSYHETTQAEASHQEVVNPAHTEAHPEVSQTSNLQTNSPADPEIPTVESVKELEKVVLLRQTILDYDQSQRKDIHLRLRATERRIAFSQCDVDAAEGQAKEKLTRDLNDLKDHAESLRRADEKLRAKTENLESQLKEAEKRLEQEQVRLYNHLQEQSMLQAAHGNEETEGPATTIESANAEKEFVEEIMNRWSMIKKGKRKEDPEKRTSISSSFGLFKSRASLED